MRDVFAVPGVRGAAVLFAAVLYSALALARTPNPSAGAGVSSLDGRTARLRLIWAF